MNFAPGVGTEAPAPLSIFNPILDGDGMEIVLVWRPVVTGRERWMETVEREHEYLYIVIVSV